MYETLCYKSIRQWKLDTKRFDITIIPDIANYLFGPNDLLYLHVLLFIDY